MAIKKDSLSASSLSSVGWFNETFVCSLFALFIHKSKKKQTFRMIYGFAL